MIDLKCVFVFVSRVLVSIVISPAKDSTQQRGVEALGRGEASLHLPNRHLVLGGGAEQREATRDRTEDLGRVGHGSHAETLLSDGQGGEGRAVQLGRNRNCGRNHEKITNLTRFVSRTIGQICGEEH